MNKNLVIQILFAYQVINDGSLSILTDDKTFNGCRVYEITEDVVVIKDNNYMLYHITIENIIGIQFMDMMAFVGMK